MASTQTDSLDDDIEILSKGTDMTASVTEKDQIESAEKSYNPEYESKLVTHKQKLEIDLLGKNSVDEKFDGT